MFLKTITKAQAALQQFKNDERGVTAIEYAIIAVAVAVMVAAVFGNGGALQTALSTAMATVTSAVDGN